ncbi:MAG: hypothetical protein Q7U02_14045, partial [Desulfosalsimonadaceae bacterium]|nr:hypothetical protein [Desulfosalsimonadaceae bacterium]
MKNFLFVLIAIVILKPVFSNAAEFIFNQLSIEGLIQAYSYILVQEYSLKKINREHPEFTSDVNAVTAKFNLAFPDIKSKLEEQFVTGIGKE